MSEEGYERHKRAIVHRLKARGHYDYLTIHRIVDSSQVLHVSFPPGADQFPVILPMLGCTGSFETYQARDKSEESQHTPGSFPGDESQYQEDLKEPRCIYLHGHATARLFKKPEEDEIPISIAATTIQGTVLTLSPFHNSNNYASAVIYGYASAVMDEAEKTYALTRITNNAIPNFWENCRIPNHAEMSSTGIIRVVIENASAKIRVGSANDDKADINNKELVGSVWTGVVPSWTTYGDPIPSDHNQVKKVPRYIQDWIAQANATGKKAALDAVSTASAH